MPGLYESGKPTDGPERVVMIIKEAGHEFVCTHYQTEPGSKAPIRLEFECKCGSGFQIDLKRSAKDAAKLNVEMYGGCPDLGGDTKLERGNCRQQDISDR